jgi:hypothetical protein
MIKIKRIALPECYANGNEAKAKEIYQSLRDNQRNYGNACAFVSDIEYDNFILELQAQNIQAQDDNYTILINEVKDYQKNNVIYLQSFFGDIPYKIMDIITQDNKTYAKVKPFENLRKKAVYINIPSQETVNQEIIKTLGLKGFEQYIKMVEYKGVK